MKLAFLSSPPTHDKLPSGAPLSGVSSQVCPPAQALAPWGVGRAWHKHVYLQYVA